MIALFLIRLFKISYIVPSLIINIDSINVKERYGVTTMIHLFVDVCMYRMSHELFRLFTTGVKYYKQITIQSKHAMNKQIESIIFVVMDVDILS